MYLVVRTENENMLGGGRKDTYDCFCMNDQVEVSKVLNSGRFKVYKLDGLQEVKEIMITAKEKVA